MTAAGPTDDSVDAITDSLLVVSRMLVAVSARSIADVDDTLTIPQFRTLVLLSNVGPMNVITLARLLQLRPSSTRRILESRVTEVLSPAESIRGRISTAWSMYPRRGAGWSMKLPRGAEMRSHKSSR